MEDEFYDILFPPYTGHVKIGDLYYDLYIDRDTLEGTAEVVRDPEASTERANYPDLAVARIPASVTYRDREYRVTGIGGMAFEGCDWMRAVELPDTITCIGELAFFGCEFESLHIPDSVTDIGDHAFDDSLTAAYNARIFACMPHSHAGEYVLPDGITTITAGAFCHRSKLTSIVLPASVETIRDSAFAGCDGLLSLTCKATIPPALGEDVFRGVEKSIPLYVPAESMALYRSAPQWCEFVNIQAMTNNT